MVRTSFENFDAITSASYNSPPPPTENKKNTSGYNRPPPPPEYKPPLAYLH